MQTVKYSKHSFITFSFSITVQHGSAITVVRAMNVKYRKWRLGGGPVTPKPLNYFHKTWQQ